MSYFYTRHSDGEVRFRSLPEIHRGDWLIDTGVLPAAETQQLGTELAWVHGPLSLQTELIWTYLGDVGPSGTNLFGAYAYASLFLTGEHRPYNRAEGKFGRVMPYENFWVVDTCRGRAAGKGAWEIALRWSSLDFSDIDGQQLHDLTFGVNWYWNPNSRLMFNWIHPFRRDNLIGTTQGDVLGMRFQVDF
jgi:phosphate-selective porin OprO/OprP